MEKVIVNSIPKAGTHLVGKLLNLLDYTERFWIEPNYIYHRGLIYKLIGFYRRMTNIAYTRGYIIGLMYPIEVKKSYIDKKLNKVKEGEFILSHLGYVDDLLNKTIELNFKPIQVIRDPRSILNSLVPYVMSNKWHPLYGIFKDMTNEERYKISLYGYFKGKIRLEPLYTRCNAVSSWINNDNVLTVKFEDLVGNKGGGNDIKQKELIIKICKHINADIDNIDTIQENLFGDKSIGFRKGKIDSWKEEIPSTIQEEANEVLKPILKMWNYI